MTNNFYRLLSQKNMTQADFVSLVLLPRVCERRNTYSHLYLREPDVAKQFKDWKTALDADIAIARIEIAERIAATLLGSIVASERGSFDTAGMAGDALEVANELISQLEQQFTAKT